MDIFWDMKNPLGRSERLLAICRLLRRRSHFERSISLTSRMDGLLFDISDFFILWKKTLDIKGGLARRLSFLLSLSPDRFLCAPIGSDIYAVKGVSQHLR